MNEQHTGGEGKRHEARTRGPEDVLMVMQCSVCTCVFMCVHTESAFVQ